MRIWQFLQEPFPYYLDNDRRNLWFSAGLGLFVTVNLTLFLPMEWIHIQKWIITGIIIFSVLYSHIVWLPKLFPGLIVPDKWTVGKYMLATFWQLVVIGWLSSVILFALGLYPGYSFKIVVIYFFLNMVIYGAVSIVVFTFIIRTVMLKNNLRKAMKANEELRRLVPVRDDHTDLEAGEVTLQSETSDTVTLDPAALLYVEADDNYVTFYWATKGLVSSKMIRANLKSIEAQLPFAHIIRCHRSYLVNAQAIVHVEGNTNGYRLSLRGTSEQIPVSRGKAPHVLQVIKENRQRVRALPPRGDLSPSAAR